MISRFNSGFKATFPQYNFPSLRPQSATVTKVQNLCNSLSSVSSIARNPSGLLKTSYSNCGKGVMSLLSGLVFSSYLGVHHPVALCAPKDTSDDSYIQGYTRKELKEKKPNLFKYFYTEDFKARETVKNVDIQTKAGSFQELLEMGEKGVEQVKGKNICIVLERRGTGNSQFVSWLAGTDMKEASNNPENDGSRSLNSKQNHVHQISSPRVVEINNEILVVMPGSQDSRAELISLANAFILEKIINAANSASFVFTVEEDDLEPTPINECEKSIFGLESISNALSSAFSASTVDNDDIKSSPMKEWEKNFNEIVDSLDFTPEEIFDFKLSQGDKSTPDHQPKSPLMVLVNNPKASSGRFSLDNLNHLASTYDPGKSDRLQMIRAFSSLEKKKFNVKMHCAKNNIEMSIKDLDRLKGLLSESLDNLPENCPLEQFKKLFDEEILPSIIYCDRLCDFAEDKTVEEYKTVRRSFEEKISLMISRWIDEVRESNNKLDANQLSSIIEGISEMIPKTPFLINSIVSKLSPLVLPKTSPHIAVCVTIASASLIAFAPFPWVAIPVVIVAGIYLNATKIDQKILHIVGERTKNYFPVINKWVHEKPNLEYLSDPYEKVLKNISDKEAKFREKRDSERGKVKSLLKEIDALLSANYLLLNEHYHRNKGEITFYLKNEDDFYDDLTKRIVDRKALSLQSSSTNPGELEETKEYYNKMHDRLHEMIKLFISKDEKYFKYFNATDKDEVVSKIKSLKVRMKSLDSTQRDFIDHGVVKKQVEISKSSVDRISRSWVESAASWGQKTVEESASTVLSYVPFIGDSFKLKPPKETS